MDARTVRHPAPLLVKLDVIGKLVTLSEREAEELRAAAAAEAGRSSARRDLSLLLDRAPERPSPSAGPRRASWPSS